MEVKKNRSYGLYIKFAIAFAIIGAVAAAFIAEERSKMAIPQTPREQVIAILENEIDFANSLFLPEENENIRAKFNDRLNELRQASGIEAVEVVEIGREAKEIKDFDSAIKLFEIAESMNPEDLFFLVDKGRIYLELQQWENARKVFEPMKVTWPVFEAYLGLAQAYENIEGTPDYVIDAIYEESIQRHQARFEVVLAYAEWLERSDREKKTIELYQGLQEVQPQPAFENKLKELQEKYPEEF